MNPRIVRPISAMFEPHLNSQLGSPSTSLVASRASETVPGRDASGGLAGDERSVPARLLRAAECLTALLQAPTAKMGLNESRFNVLDVLERQTSTTCSQTELAQQLLQSESNLSTLLDRMNQDGLISRVRSVNDRRVTLIALSAAGRELLSRAAAARARAAATVFEIFDEPHLTALHEALGLLHHKLEQTLGIAGRARARVDSAARLQRRDRHQPAEIEQPDKSARSRATLQNSDESKI